MRKLLILLLAGVLIFGLSALSFGADEDQLVIGTTDRVTNFTPANSYDHYTWHCLRNLTDGLVQIKPKTTEVAPALAKDWEVGPNAQVYTFYLREDVTFTDGTPLTAELVKKSLERTMRLDGPQGGVFLVKEPIDTIEVIDEYTLKFTLKEPNATFLTRMTGQIGPALIFNPEAMPEDDFVSNPVEQLVGVGPYKLSKFQPDQSVIYEAYEGYYAGAPKMKTVIELKYANNTQLRTAIEAGDIDIAFRTLNPIDIIDLEESPNLEVQHTEAAPSVRYLLFNHANPIFKDQNVRRAITYAVDRQAIVDQVFSGVAAPIYTMVPRGWIGRINTFPKRDLEKAAELLEKAGYAEDNPLYATLWFTPKHYGTTEADVAAVLKGSLEEVPALKVEVRSLEWGAYTERMGEGGFGMFLLGWYPDYLESSNFLEPWTTGAPEGLGTYFNVNPNFDKYKDLFKKAFATPEPELRAKYYESIQTMSAYDVPFLPLWANLAQAYVVYKPNVKNCFVDQTMDIRIEGIYKE